MVKLFSLQLQVQVYPLSISYYFSTVGTGTVKHDILATGKYSDLVALWQIACRTSAKCN